MTPVYTCQKSKCYNFEVNSSLRVLRDRHPANFVGGNPIYYEGKGNFVHCVSVQNGRKWSHLESFFSTRLGDSWSWRAENVTRNFDSQRC